MTKELDSLTIAEIKAQLKAAMQSKLDQESFYTLQQFCKINEEFIDSLTRVERVINYAEIECPF